MPRALWAPAELAQELVLAAKGLAEQTQPIPAMLPPRLPAYEVTDAHGPGPRRTASAAKAEGGSLRRARHPSWPGRAERPGTRTGEGAMSPVVPAGGATRANGPGGAHPTGRAAPGERRAALITCVTAVAITHYGDDA